MILSLGIDVAIRPTLFQFLSVIPFSLSFCLSLSLSLLSLSISLLSPSLSPSCVHHSYCDGHLYLFLIPSHSRCGYRHCDTWTRLVIGIYIAANLASSNLCPVFCFFVLSLSLYLSLNG